MTTDVNKRPTVDDREYWEILYRMQKTPWELNTFSPPLKTFLDSPYKVPPGRIFVAGCGTGHDALFFASRGFEVHGVDFAPSAIRATQQKFQQAGVLNSKGFLLERDVFDMHDYDGYFDYALDHAFFCSIHPSRRKQYAYTLRDLLKPTGKLIAVFWLIERQGGGAPFATTNDDIFATFKELFSFDIVFEPPDSVPSRKGKELFCLMSVKK
ncbi:MAG TPA: methyltransferase domain-containing protein [Candidatus Obscuribacterales bacterium]